MTTFNGLRHTRARAGEVVAVLGLGGLGHLGVQFAARMGFETVAVARGPEKAQFATDLGAHHYIDSTSSDVAAGLQRLGGASVVLATVTNGPAMTATIGGLRPRGEWTGPLPHGLDDGLTGILARDAGARSVATSTDLAAADLEMSARSGARPGAVARAVRPLTASAYAPPRPPDQHRRPGGTASGGPPPGADHGRSGARPGRRDRHRPPAQDRKTGRARARRRRRRRGRAGRLQRAERGTAQHRPRPDTAHPAALRGRPADPVADTIFCSIGWSRSFDSDQQEKGCPDRIPRRTAEPLRLAGPTKDRRARFRPACQSAGDVGQGGDSGGAIFSLAANDKVTAKGIGVGAQPYRGVTYLTLTPIQVIASDFRIAVNIG